MCTASTSTRFHSIIPFLYILYIHSIPLKFIHSIHTFLHNFRVFAKVAISSMLKNMSDINKNIFNNFLIAAPRRTYGLLFQKLPNLAPALTPTPSPKSENAPVLHRSKLGQTHPTLHPDLMNLLIPKKSSIILSLIGDIPICQRVSSN